MRPIRIAFFVALVILMIACVVLPGSNQDEGGPPPSQTEQPGGTGSSQQEELQTALPSEPCSQNDNKLLFSSDYYAYPDTEVNFDIYVANPDGSVITRLTEYPLWEGYPAWSPDHCRIAYAASISGESQTEIHVMNADGTDTTRLTFD
ncbi:MAG: hypothetical protein MUO76_04030, partial [Anaerolineaceae bacterium]|nr:hypothetical protein [Anaerolineaceae bacterium]